MFLENYINQIKSLCENHKVKLLYVFGSVLNENFNEKSDIDFVVEIKASDPIEYAENYFDLKFGLEELLKKPVDLLENKAIKNPYFIKFIQQTKKPIFLSGKTD